MDISEISHKANSRPITNRLYQLDAEEFNAMLDELVNLRSLVADSGTVYSVRIQNNLDSRNLAASTGKPCMLAFTFLSRMRDGAEDWEATGESATLTVSVKNSNYQEFEAVKTIKVADATPMTLDVSEWLLSGSNQIMLVATGEISAKTTSALVYTVQLTSLGISAEGFVWWTAYKDDFRIPYRIAGNISKTLVVTVSGSGYSKTYETQLGTGVFVDSPYNYIVPHPKRTGVFKVSAYLRNSDGTIRTSNVSYNVICYIQGATSKLIAINNVADHAVNWNETDAFEYAVFEGSATTTSVTFKVTKEDLTVFSRSVSALATQAKHTFVLPLEVETIDDVDFNIIIGAYNGEFSMTEPITMKVLNSLGYSPTAGASVYINPRTRSNSESNRMVLVNEVNGQTLPTVCRNMNWYNDGWTKDEDGNSILRVMAGGFMDTGIPALKPESARIGRLIELDYKVDNVTDFDTPIIDCSVEHMGSFIGFKVFPDRILVYSAAQKTLDDQSFKFNTGDRLHMAIAIMPDIYGNKDFNLCKLYVDGVVNREFHYTSNDYFLTDSTIKLGSEYADVDIYGIRVYNFSISADAVIQNNVSWRQTNDEKAVIKARNDVYDATGSAISIDKVKTMANVIVFEGEIPSKRNPGKFRNNWDVLWRDHPEWNIYIKNIQQDGQGTSAKFYDDYNQRGKADSKTTWYRSDGTSGTGPIPYIPGLPAIKTWTNKINWASSCQCNKMGSVNSIHDLCELMDLLNEVKSRAAIWQEPFVGFQRTFNEEGEPVYTFLGLYTGGPDKGDLASLGLDTDAYPDLLFVEGADNAAPGALFKVPWNSKKKYWKYNADEESMQYNGINCWDYDGGAAETTDDIQALYEKVWMPRYNFVYQCSHNLTYWSGTIDDLNSAENILLHRNDDTEFWVDGGDVYYYESAEGKFMPSDIGGGTINLFTQLVDKGYGLTSAMCSGKTNAQLNALFSAARVMKFNLEAPSWFHKGASIFSRNWMEFFAGSDNRTKNTYFIMLGTAVAGFLCYLFWDDTDTIGPWTNQGQDKKGYWVEVGDKYDNGDPVWNGEQNRFYNLIEAAWSEEIVEEMRTMMNSMITLSGSEVGNNSDKLYKFVHKYYFSKAQEYFPEALYNGAARIMYEDAKLAYIAGTYTNDTDPITQSMGNYYSGWKRWIKYRIQYMQSKYMFGDYSASGGDSIVVRASGNDITYDITPAIWLYPCVATGTSIIRGNRTKAGEVCQVTISLGGAADQQTHIKGPHYLQSIGGWWDKHVTGQMIVVGRMLRELRIGHESEKIVISISMLTIREAPSLQLLDVRRISTLSGVLDLTVCTHMRYIYASGTAVTQIVLPGGGPLQYIEYSRYNQYLLLRNFPQLKGENVVISECKDIISDLLIENCPQINPIELLRSIITAQSSSSAQVLKRIRAVGFDVVGSYEDLDTLAIIASGNYQGMDPDGYAIDGLPVVEGTLSVENAYQDSLNKIGVIYPNLKVTVTGYLYFRFADPEVLRIIAEQWGDGVGTTQRQIESVTNIGTVFQGNSLIKTFEEFEQFKGLKSIPTNAFKGSSIQKICIPSTVTEILGEAFEGCTSLDEVVGLTGNTSITFISSAAFGSCKLSNLDLNLPSLIQLNGWAFQFSSIKRVSNIGKVNEIGSDTWRECNNLEYVNLGGTVNKIGQFAFYICPNLKTVLGLENVRQIGYRAFYQCTSLIIDDLYLPKAETLSEACLQGVRYRKISSLGKIKVVPVGLANYCEELEEVVLPETVIEIKGGAFRDCLNLTKINIPQSVEIIGGYAFHKVPIESDIYLPNLKKLESFDAFNSTLIKSLNLPKVEYIASNTFRNCLDLKTVDLGSYLTELYGGAFANCRFLESVIIRSITPPSGVSTDTFYATNNCPIYVPDASVEAYKTASGWNNYATRIKPLSEFIE